MAPKYPSRRQVTRDQCTSCAEKIKEGESTPRSIIEESGKEGAPMETVADHAGFSPLMAFGASPMEAPSFRCSPLSGSMANEK